MLLDDAAAQGSGSSRRLYSYLSCSDNNDEDEARLDQRRRRQREDWRARAPARRDGGDDDDDGMSSPSWVPSGTGSESDSGDEARTRHDVVVDGGFTVYSRINDLGLPACFLTHLHTS